MKTKHIVLAAALLGGLLSTSAFAVTTDAHAKAVAAMKFEAPVPAEVVQPTGLSPSLVGETVQISLTIDAAGKPHDVKAMSSHDQALLRNVVAAVSQWKFTPARMNGVPVATKAVLPLRLVES